MNLHTRARGRVRFSATAALTVAGLGASAAGLAAPAAADRYERLKSVRAKNHILDGSRTTVRGRMAPEDADREIWIQARWRGSRGWRTVAKDTTGSSGRFKRTWEPPAVGRYSVRAVLTGSDAEPRRVRGDVTVYRAAEASWYGPGFWGNTTACGQTLEGDTLGVAHKSLPCGTKVRFYYNGNTVTAPVIDRGPYAGNREWDLTAETKSRLNFPSTGTVWAAPQGG